LITGLAGRLNPRRKIMALEDYREDMEMCCRCSICKFIPLEMVRDAAYTYACPSIARIRVIKCRG
jgi:hypothetical protein